MPRAADRLLPPPREATPRRIPVAALAVAGSILVHGAALAAAVGFWGEDDAAVARPFEVVMITVARPGPAPAAAPAQRASAPGEAERVGPPAVAMPVAEAANPAVRAPVPVSKSVASAPSAAVTDSEPVPATLSLAPPAKTPVAEAAPEPARIDTPPPAALAATAIETAQVERLDMREPADDAPPPHPVPRPKLAATAAATAIDGRRPAGQPETPAVTRTGDLDGADAPETVASRAGQRERADDNDSRPAEFALGSAGNPVPDYPRRARQRGWQGRVVLHVAVDRQGHAVRVAVRESSGHGVLDDAAYRTVSTWVFQPATRSGRRVPGEAIVPVVFRLN